MGCSLSASVVDKFVFPAPEESSYGDWSFKGEIFWVPVNYGTPEEKPGDDNYDFPCRLLQSEDARYLVIYFHKNADDLGSCRWFVEKLRSLLTVHVLVVEYPGYGLCSAHSANASQVNKHALAALTFAQHALAWSLDRIIVLGSCIGVGPAVSLAAIAEFAGLVLISPFLSVRSIVRSHSRLAACFVNEQYPLYEMALPIRCPTLIFHGQMDKMVPFAHAEKLYNLLKCKKELISLEGVGHSTPLTQDEVLTPMRNFISSIELPGLAAKSLTIPPWAFQRGHGNSRPLPQSLLASAHSQEEKLPSTSLVSLMPVVVEKADIEIGRSNESHASDQEGIMSL